MLLSYNKSLVGLSCISALFIWVFTSCGDSTLDKQYIFSQYAKECGIKLNWNTTDILFILRPTTGCKSCYKSLHQQLQDKDQSSNPNMSVIYVGEPIGLPLEDMKGIRKRFGTQVYLDSTDLLRSYNLDALSSGYFYQGENEELHFEYFLINGGSKLDSLLLTF